MAWKRVVHFQEDRELTDQALQRCIAFILEACDLIAARDLAKDAFRISVEDGISFYDSLFLAASEREKVPLMTMDRRLCKKVSAKRYATDLRHRSSRHFLASYFASSGEGHDNAEEWQGARTCLPGERDAICL